MDILFWSGGKDAYLALQFYRKTEPRTELTLLTTFDEETDVVPHQNIHIEDIQSQADFLGLDLITVPLPPDCPNDKYLERLQEALDNINAPIEHLIFGDWHLEDIRQWREGAFSKMGYSCIFPIWKKSLHKLLPELLLTPVKVEISAVKEEFKPLIRVGEDYDQTFVNQIQRLSQDIDPMGEHGEFHTKVIFQDFEKPGELMSR